MLVLFEPREKVDEHGPERSVVVLPVLQQNHKQRGDGHGIIDQSAVVVVVLRRCLKS